MQYDFCDNHQYFHLKRTLKKKNNRYILRSNSYFSFVQLMMDHEIS